MKKNGWRMLAGAVVGAFLILGSETHAQVVVKVVDLATGLNQTSGQPIGTATPYGGFMPFGSNLWFLTQGGGTNGMGTVSQFVPSTGQVDMLATLGSTDPTAVVGKTSFGSPVLIGGRAWFTTSAGGSGSKGSIAYIDTNTDIITTAYSFPSTSTTGSGPRGNPLQIGDDLYVLTSLGGTSSKGTLVKFNMTSSNVTVIQNFDGTNFGAQPFGCTFTQVSNNYYFTTFTGGTNTSPVNGQTFNNGAGTLGKLSFDISGTPSVTKVLDLPGGPTAFPTGAPVLVGSNSLYFTTVGSNPDPGAIVRYDVGTGLWTNIFTFASNAATTFGKQPYCTPVEWNNELYFTTFTGGSTNKGVLAKITLTNNAYAKLADLDGPNLGGQPQYTTGIKVHNNLTGRDSLYFTTKTGGANNIGTILHVYFPPPPLVVNVATTNSMVNLSWTGGYAPFVVQSCADITSGFWNTEAEGLTNTSFSLPANGATLFYRVGGVSE